MESKIETGQPHYVLDTQRYKTLGNAVTTNVIKALITKIYYES